MKTSPSDPFKLNPTIGFPEAAELTAMKNEDAQANARMAGKIPFILKSFGPRTAPKFPPAAQAGLYER